MATPGRTGTGDRAEGNRYSLTPNPQTLAFPPPIVPKLKAEERPQGFAVIDLARPVLVEQSAHEGDVEQSLPPQLISTQGLLHQRPQLVPHPTGDGNGEPALLPVDNIVRKPTLHGLLQDVLDLEAAHLEAAGQPFGKLNQAVIEKWRAHLQRARHAGAIDLHQQVILQVQAKIQVEHFGECLIEARALQHSSEGREDFAAGRPRARPIRRKKLVELRGIEHAEPDVVALRRFLFRMAQEPAQEKALGNRRRGDGKKPLETAKNLTAHHAGELQVIVRQARSHISGITAEKLVATFAAQRHLDVFARKTRNKPTQNNPTTPHPPPNILP